MTTPTTTLTKLLKTKLALFLLALATLGLASSGCADDIVEYDNCRQICERYQDCVDADYDASACTSECESKSDTDKDYAQSANECEACLDDRSCSGSWPCTAECSVVVP